MSAPAAPADVPAAAAIPPPPSPVSLGWGVTAAAVVAGLLPRLILIREGHIISDEAVVGLMGMEILKGHHFVFYMGQGYMGSLEPYLAALLFAVFGVSAAALKAAPFLFSLAAAWFHFRFAARIFDDLTARLALVLLFCSSWVYTVWSVAPRGGYMTALALGGAALLVGARIAGDSEGGSARDNLLLGFLGGLGMWTHFFFVYYLAPLGLLVVLPALRRRGRVRRFLCLAAGFIAGALPAIAWNLRHHMGSLNLKKGFVRPDAWGNLHNLLARQLPYLLGGERPDAGRAYGPAVTWLLLAVWAAAAAWYLLRAARRCGHDGAGCRAALLVPGVVATAAALFVRSGFGAGVTQRYLLPVYPVAAVALALLLADLWRRRAALGAALLLFVVGANLWGAGFYVVTKGIPEGRALRRDAAAILDFCRTEGVHAAWGGYWSAYLLTFLGAENPVVADFDRTRYEPFRRLVADSPDPALVAEGNPKAFELALANAGLRSVEGRGGPYTVFAHVRPDPALGPLDRRVDVRVTGTGGGAFEPLGTGGVRTRGPLARGDRVSLALDRSLTVNGLILSPGSVPHEHADGFAVETSLDGEAWERAVEVRAVVPGLRWEGGRVLWDTSGIVETHFPPRPAAFIRVTSAAESRVRAWRVERAWATVTEGPRP
jgi:4-amino-4-deoxy-L-arabinose transferase-like glycosyltransferase